MVNELQSLLKQRKDTLESLENEKDLLEKEKILKDTEIKVRNLHVMSSTVIFSVYSHT